MIGVMVLETRSVDWSEAQESILTLQYERVAPNAKKWKYKTGQLETESEPFRDYPIVANQSVSGPYLSDGGSGQLRSSTFTGNKTKV
jgi:hypothetical protein